jgi:hypothetical protein
VDAVEAQLQYFVGLTLIRQLGFMWPDTQIAVLRKIGRTPWGKYQQQEPRRGVISMKSRLVIIALVVTAIPAFAKLGDTLLENMKNYGSWPGCGSYRGYPEYRFLWTDKNNRQWGVNVVLKSSKTVRIEYFKVPDFHQAIFKKSGPGYELIGGTREATRFSDEEIKMLLEEEELIGWTRSVEDDSFYQNKDSKLIGSVQYNAFMDEMDNPFSVWGLWSLSIETEDFQREMSFLLETGVVTQASRDLFALKDQYQKWKEQQNGKCTIYRSRQGR